MATFIDTHQHLWDLSLFKLPWTDGGGDLAKDHLIGDYQTATEKVNVSKTVYMEVDMHPSQRMAEANYVTDLCLSENNPMAGAVISGEPSDVDFAQYAAQFSDNRYIKGIRRILHPPETSPAHCLQSDFVKGIQELGNLNLSFDICVRPSELKDAINLVDQCPDTRFVVDHCGNADPYIVSQQDSGSAGDWRENPYAHERRQWMDDMDNLGEYPNVICKISGIIARVRKGWSPNDLAPTVNHCLNAFGPDKVVFGGDWPVCTVGGATFEQWANALLQIISVRSEVDQSKLLYENANDFYGLG